MIDIVTRSRILPAVCLGALSGITTAQTLLSEWPGHRVRAADSIPDLDGDGFRELLVGDIEYPYLPGTTYGRVYAASGLSGEILYQRSGVVELEVLGSYMTSIDDVTGDGFPDFMSTTGRKENGTGTFVFDGKDGSVVYQHPNRTSLITSLGDLNGDGHGDVFLNPNVYFGGNGTLAYQFSVSHPTILSNSFVAFFGWSSTVLDDLNGDGVPDFAVGAPGDIVNENGGMGFVFVYSGATGEELYHLEAPEGNLHIYVPEEFGYDVADPGDVNGDGIGDLVVGAPKAGEVPAGTVYFFDGPTGELIYKVIADRSGPLQKAFGRWVEAAGDVNGNGFGDVLVTVISATMGVEELLVLVLDGRAGELLFEIPRSLIPWVGDGHDWNGDGFPDFAAWGGLYPNQRMSLYSGAPPGVTSLGSPCPAQEGPRIGATGSPEVGAGATIHLSGVPPGRRAALLIGPADGHHLLPAPCSAGSTGVQPRCRPRVRPDRLFLARTEEIRPGEGAATVLVPIVNDPALIGARIRAQWMVEDPSSPGGWSLSRVLQLEAQPAAAPSAVAGSLVVEAGPAAGAAVRAR